MVKSGYKHFLGTAVLASIFTICTVSGLEAQNLYMNNYSGLMTFGSVSFIQPSNESALGISYSFHGNKSIGISYGRLMENGAHFTNLGIAGNFLLKKQGQDDVMNVELSPVFRRVYHKLSEKYASMFSMGIGFSRDFSATPGMDLVPRVSFSYLASPSVGVDNYLGVGLDMGVGFDINSSFKFVVDPGFNLNVDRGIVNGSIMGGVILSGY